MANTSELKKIRPCGRLETYSTSRHYKGHYNNVALTATYTFPSVASESLQTLVYAALRPVIAKHPSLSAITLNEDKSYPHVYFAQLPSVDLRTCVEFRQRREPTPSDGEVDKELDSLLKEQHCLGYKADTTSQPFWRLIIMTAPTEQSTFTAMWAFHHASADGNSSFLFHETFLASLNALESDPNADPIVEASTAPFQSPFEDMHPMTLSIPFMAKKIAQTYLPSVFDKRPKKLWTGNNIPTHIAPNIEFKFRTFILSADVTKKLAQMSRKENTSVTATLEALLAASMFVQLPAKDVDMVKISGPISMRRFLKDVPETQIINAVGQWDLIHHRSSYTPSAAAATPEKASVAQLFSWEEARSIKAAIQAEVAKEGRDNNVALLKFVPNIHKYFAGYLGKPRARTAEISNIGVYKCKSETTDRWQIGRVTFSQCAYVGAGAFGVNVVTGGDGNASVNVCWVDGAVEDELLGRIMQGMMDGIQELVSGSDPANTSA